MPSFNPSVIITTIDAEPWKTGRIGDSEKRADFKKIQMRFLAASPAERPAITLEGELFLDDHQETLTVGSAIISALLDPLKGDEDVTAEEKQDRDLIAIRVRQARNEGVTATVSLTNKELATIKARVNKRWPEARIVAEVLRAIQPDDPAQAGSKTDD